jgi:spermidine synthase
MSNGERIIFRGQSPYSKIVLTEDPGGLRTLRFGEDGPFQSVVDPRDPEHLDLEYTRVLPLALAFIPAPERILTVGLGGGTVPRFFRHYFPECAIEVVDIDPMVVDVARRYCGFVEDDRMRVHIEDARDFIEGSASRYDLVILDTSDSESIPRHLRTVEFLQAVRRILTKHGVVAANVWGRTVNPLYDSMLVTYRDIFECMYIFDVPGPGTKVFAALNEGRAMSRGELVNILEDLFTQRGFREKVADSLTGFRDARNERARGGEILRD